MARKHHKPEEIVAKLQQIEVLAEQGKPLAEGVQAADRRGVVPSGYWPTCLAH